MTLPIVTARLRLRRFAYGDIDNLIALVAHSSVAVETPEIEATPVGARKYIDFQNQIAAFQVGKCVDLAVEHQDEGKVIGLLSLILQRHRQAEIGYALAAGYRGQGYATEAARGLVDYAFTTLGLHRLSANTNSENVASQRLLERLGMSLEGRLRQAVQREGRWLDKLLYGILLHEWLRE